MAGALEKLGGKYWNFDEGDGEFSQHYTWSIPFYFTPADKLQAERKVVYLEINTVTI